MTILKMIDNPDDHIRARMETVEQFLLECHEIDETTSVSLENAIARLQECLLHYDEYIGSFGRK
jgi:hypothetical protein